MRGSLPGVTCTPGANFQFVRHNVNILFTPLYSHFITQECGVIYVQSCLPVRLSAATVGIIGVSGRPKNSRWVSDSHNFGRNCSLHWYIQVIVLLSEICDIGTQVVLNLKMHLNRLAAGLCAPQTPSWLEGVGPKKGKEREGERNGGRAGGTMGIPIFETSACTVWALTFAQWRSQGAVRAIPPPLDWTATKLLLDQYRSCC